MSNRIGLVFGGGGGKGAYQIGVWKALLELGFDKSVRAVSGTSVGALNAALFLQGDYRKAEKTWLTISPEKILSLKSASIVESLQQVGVNMIDSKMYRYAQSIQGYGMFSRHGLLKLIDESINLNTIAGSKIPFYVTCCQLGSHKPKYFLMNGQSSERMKSLILATSAIPGIFQKEEIDGKYYIDGGIPLIGDNLPIRPIYQDGFDIIIVVPLNRSDVIDKSQFPKARIIEILPREHQGGLLDGTLQFTAAGAKRRIEQGYLDAKAILEPTLRAYRVEQHMSHTAHRVLRDHEEFSKDHKAHNVRLSDQMNDFEKKLLRGRTL
jgi:NTE family protein